MIAFIALPLVACNKGTKKNSSISVGRTVRGPTQLVPNGTAPTQLPGWNTSTAGTPGTNNNGRLWGAIHSGSSMTEDSFNQSVHNFVSATLDPNQLGHVSGNIYASTGVRFWGYVEVNGTSIVAQSSELRVVIWDSYAGYVDASGDLITEYPVHMRGNASGWVSGNQAVVRFQDQYGWIELRGNFDSQYFSGVVWYSNNNGAQGQLGDFFVGTCSFFRCY